VCFTVTDNSVLAGTEDSLFTGLLRRNSTLVQLSIGHWARNHMCAHWICGYRRAFFNDELIRVLWWRHEKMPWDCWKMQRLLCSRAQVHWKKEKGTPFGRTFFILDVCRIVPYFYDTLWVIQFTPCCSTKCDYWCTMDVSSFGPYHRLVHHGDAPSKHAGIVLIPWPWAMPLALGLNAILLGGEWHMPSPPPRKCQFSCMLSYNIIPCLWLIFLHLSSNPFGLRRVFYRHW